MKTLTHLIVSALFVVTASPVAAQGISGRWITEFDRSVRNENGNVTTGDKAKALIVLTQKGDSVTGTWEVLDRGPSQSGPTAPPRQLRGTIAGNKVSLSMRVDGKRNINGEESAVSMTMLYDLTVDGDKLQGTTTAKSSDMEMPARPFSAWRETKAKNE